MGKLVIPEALYQRVHDHLLRDGSEHVVFFLCNPARAKGVPIFIARDVILVPDADLAGPHRFGIDLELDALLAILNQAIKRKMALVEAHSHPSSDHPAFSAYDRAGLKEFVPYVLSSIPEVPYAATVWGRYGVAGLCWSTWPQKDEDLDTTVVGSQIWKFQSRPPAGYLTVNRFDRQVRAFGSEAQQRIGSLSIGVVGLGGLGSHVAQQLAYLGIRHFVLVDSQAVEETNLNRLVGATPDDIGKPKVEVAGKWIKRIAPRANVGLMPLDLRTSAAFEALKLTDVIFGCVDNDGARLVLNELGLAFLIPYIDCGVEINMEGGRLCEVGGRVNFVLPSGPCLHCMGQVDLEEARISLAPPEELARARQLGYVIGADVPAPSVVSLNGLVASAAVTEFINLVAAVRTPSPMLIYDMMGVGRGRTAQWVTPQAVEKMDNCLECGLTGVGDAVALDRYILDLRS